MSGAALFIRNPASRKETLLTAIGDEASIGNSSGADVHLDDLRTNGIHALLTRDSVSQDFVLIDLGSKCGTYVKGKRIREARLKAGEVFTIGNKHLVLRPQTAETARELSLRPDGGRKQKPVSENSTGSKVAALGTSGQPAPVAALDLLQVSLYWGEQLLEIRTFEPGAQITLGTQREATFGVTFSDPKLNNAPYPVCSYRKGMLAMVLPPEATGIVWMGTDSYHLDNIRQQEGAVVEFGTLKLDLKPGDRGDLHFGQLTLAFRFISRSEKIKESWVPQFDKSFFKIGLLLLPIYGALFMLFTNSADLKPQEKTLDDLPPNVKKSMFNAGLAKAILKRRASIGQLAHDLQGGRAKGEEGKATAQKAPPKVEPPKHVEVAKAPNKAAARPTQVAKAHHGQAPHRAPIATPKPTETKVDLDSAFATTTTSKSLAKSVTAAAPGQQVQTGNTVAAFAEAGSFARGTKGQGAGGGGQSVGIGQLSGYSTGGAGGAADYGLLPSRGHEIKVPEAEEIEILGGLDQDVIASIIRRYLSQIQNCYEQQLVTNNQLRGKVTVAFTISGTGSVAAAQVADTTLANPPTEKCMLEKIMKWKFPKPRGGGTVGVKYPFLLMSNTGR